MNLSPDQSSSEYAQTLLFEKILRDEMSSLREKYQQEILERDKLINQLQNHTVIKNKGSNYQYDDLYLNTTNNNENNNYDISMDGLKSIHDNYELRIKMLRDEMEEKEQLWSRKFFEQEQELDRMQERYKQLDARLEERLIRKEKSIIRDFTNNEYLLQSRIDELTSLLLDKEKSVNDRYSIEMEANNLATLARIEAREEELKAEYERKLKVFEKRSSLLS